MTEEEKRRLALEIFAQEQSRLQNRTASVLNAHNDRVQSSLRRSEKKAAMFDSLAQNGITWEDLRAAYDDSFKRGHEAMINFKLAYFYAGTAIAVHERFNTDPKQCADFIHLLLEIAEEDSDRPTLVAHALQVTGVNTSVYDQDSVITSPGRARMPMNAHASRADEWAIRRMKKSGITEADLEYERKVGYDAGWNTGFGYSACYASLALGLKRTFQSSAEEIESIFDRIGELEYEEISAADIIERAKVEAGVDVGDLAKAPPVS